MQRPAPYFRSIFLILISAGSVAALPAFMNEKGLDLDHRVMTTWTDRDGLQSNTVLDVVQDKTGYVWLASYDGLTRFDGSQFRVFNKSDSYGYDSNSARVLTTTPDGTLWIGSNTDGLFAHNGDSFVKFGLSSGLPDLSIRALGVDATGRLWVGTTKGIAFFDGTSFKTYDTKVASAFGICNFFLVTPNGALLTGSNLPGLWEVGEDGLKPFKTNLDLSSLSFSAAGMDADGSIWLGTSTGQLLRILKDGETSQFQSGILGGASVNSFFLRRDGILMIATDRGVLSPKDNGFESFAEDNGLANNVVSSFWEDIEGNVWVGTEHGGLVKFSKGKFLNYSKREGLISDSVNAVTEDQFGSVWVGTDEGLSFFPSTTDLYGKDLKRTQAVDGVLTHLKKARIRQIRFDQDKLLFATYTTDALLTFDGTQTSTVSQDNGLPINRVRMSYKDGSGRLWIATTAGLVLYDNEKATHFGQKEGLPNDFVMDVHDDGKGNIWVGTDGGGIASIRGDRIQTFSTKDGLAGDVVFRIFQDSRGGLWFCSSEGISLFSGGAFQNLGRREGLLSDTVFQMLEDSKGMVYMTTNLGLAVVSLDELYQRIEGRSSEIKQAVYGRLDGLPGQPTSNAWAYLSKDGVYYLPTINGLAVLDAAIQGPNQLVPPVLIESVDVDGQSRSVYGMGLTLAPDAQRLTIGYTALSFVVPEKVGFEYKLDGYERDWVKSFGQRNVSYTNLPAGNYVFRVRAWNDDGLINLRGAELGVTREPYWYATPYAMAGLAVLILVFGFLINNIRVGTLRRRESQLAKIVETRTAELETERLRGESMVRSLLPRHVADELLETGKATPQMYGPLTVLCAEVMNFHEVSRDLGPSGQFDELGEVFTAFDEICSQHGCERLKTTGTVYYAICGLSTSDEQHAVLSCAAAVDIMRYIIRHNQNRNMSWNIRIGIESGEVAAGIVGNDRYLYDVFGKAVDIAFDLCRSGGSGSIICGPQASARTGEKYRLVQRRGHLPSFFIKYRDDLIGKNGTEVFEYYRKAKASYDSANYHPASETLEDIDITICEPLLASRMLKLKGNVYYKLGRKKLAELTWRRALDGGMRDPVLEQNLAVMAALPGRRRKKT